MNWKKALLHNKRGVGCYIDLKLKKFLPDALVCDEKKLLLEVNNILEDYITAIQKIQKQVQIELSEKFTPAPTQIYGFMDGYLWDDLYSGKAIDENGDIVGHHVSNCYEGVDQFFTRGADGLFDTLFPDGWEFIFITHPEDHHTLQILQEIAIRNNSSFEKTLREYNERNKQANINIK